MTKPHSRIRAITSTDSATFPSQSKINEKDHLRSEAMALKAVDKARAAHGGDRGVGHAIEQQILQRTIDILEWDLEMDPPQWEEAE